MKWHDGKPFTSADVKWTYDDLIKEGTKAQAFRIITTLKSVEAPDAKTVVFSLSETDALFLVGLAGYYGANVLPKHLYEGTDVRKNPYNTKPVGTGPFKVVELVTGSHLTLEANPDYYGLGPYLDQLIFKVVPNLATMMSTLETGEVGYSAPSPPFGDVARLRTLPNMKVDQAESQIVQWTAFNLDIPKFKDIRVRQAIIHAIDKQAISTQVFAGLVTPVDRDVHLDRPEVLQREREAARVRHREGREAARRGRLPARSGRHPLQDPLRRVHLLARRRARDGPGDQAAAREGRHRREPRGPGVRAVQREDHQQA